MSKKKFKLSIITPFYNEAGANLIDVFFSETIKHLTMVTSDYEIICIDDGSQDDTFKQLCQHHISNNKIKVIKLSRNFGKEAALTAGLDKAQGDIVIPMDADLQDPPRLIPEMIKYWQQGYDVVLPYRATRDEGFVKKLFAKLFYKLMNIMVTNGIPVNAGDFRLMDKKVLNEIIKLREYHRFNKGILSFGGFKVKKIHFNRPKRLAGLPKQSTTKLMGLALNGILSFSVIPIRVLTLSGLLVAACSFLYGLFIIFQKLISPHDLYNGYASILTLISFFGGINLMSIGIIGEYIGRIYEQSKQRPIYIIDQELK